MPVPRTRSTFSDDPHREQIERYVAAYNSFDLSGMLALLHPEIVFENVAGGEVTAVAHGIEEFRQLAERSAQLFASRRQTIRDYRSDEDGATIEIDYEGVLAEELSPELRSGDTLRLSGRSTFEFRDGRIARIVDES
jgi:ketosteroid isomerase-like protein